MKIQLKEVAGAGNDRVVMTAVIELSKDEAKSLIEKIDKEGLVELEL